MGVGVGRHDMMMVGKLGSLAQVAPPQSCEISHTGPMAQPEVAQDNYKRNGSSTK